MDASAMCDDGKLTSPSWTVVLVGRTGNGKSATGNSILGRKAFKSRASSSGVANTCELESTLLKDGQIINVIDTPGLFDFSSGMETMRKCLNLAKDGIHAILVVLSVRTRFSQEEEAALRCFKNFFGSKSTDYMIVVFTGGDELEANDETLEDYLGRECPEPLKEILSSCHNRYVLFDNKTEDETQKAKQLQQLLSLVKTVMSQNGGRPFTEATSIEFQVESNLKESTSRLEQKLAEEKAARLEAEKNAQAISNGEIRKLTAQLEQKLAEEQAARLEAEKNAKTISNDEIRKLTAQVEKARMESEALRRQLAEPRKRDGGNRCTIL